MSSLIEWADSLPAGDTLVHEYVVQRWLHDLVGDLIINTNPWETLPTGEEYRSSCEEKHSISLVLYQLIKASHLNTLDVALSATVKLDRVLKREKSGWGDFTSLSLFADDVERLLRELYGETDEDAIDQTRCAVIRIVEEFTKYLRKDIWQEHQNALDVDYMHGIGVPEGYCISGSEIRRGLCAADDLEVRARAVRADPEAYSKYTIEFVNELFSEWRSLSHPGEVQPAAEVPF
jgi:hypothetical protein